MKLLITIFYFLTTVFSLFGQTQNIFPDTFPKSPGFKAVLVIETCLTCPDKERISEKFLFNDKGQNIAWYPLCNNKPCGEQKYMYNDDKLVSYTNRNNWVSTSTTGDFGMEWDSTSLSNKLEYSYENHKLVKTIWTDGETNRRSLEIEYKYDDGKLQSETITDFPNPNSIGIFNPNSTEYTEDEDLEQVTLKKEYSYSDSTTTIRYFKKGSLTGIETNIKNKKGELLKSTLRDSSGKILKVITYTYDQDRLKQIEMNESGYDGFGNPYDYLGYDKESYEYNSDGRLSLRKFFSNGQLILFKKYEYKK